MNVRNMLNGRLSYYITGYFPKASKQAKLNNILFKNTYIWSKAVFKKKKEKC